MLSCCSAIQRRRAKLFSPATAAAHVTFDHHISWRESQLVIFGWRNVNPRISAAFHSTVLSESKSQLQYFVNWASKMYILPECKKSYWNHDILRDYMTSWNPWKLIEITIFWIPNTLILLLSITSPLWYLEHLCVAPKIFCDWDWGRRRRTQQHEPCAKSNNKPKWKWG